MGRPASTRPTATEIEVLNVMWSNTGPTTIAQVTKNLNPRRAYTSVATIVRILVAKKYVAIISEKRPQTFQPSIEKSNILSDGIDDFLSKYGDMLPTHTRRGLNVLSNETRISLKSSTKPQKKTRRDQEHSTANAGGNQYKNQAPDDYDGE
jgi:predicted transcriptional regulator